VDFIVYDKDNAILGYVINDNYYCTDNIEINTIGEEKSIFIPDGVEADIKMFGVGDGSFSYILEEYDDNGVKGRVNHYDIPLSVGNSFSQSIDSNTSIDDEDTVALYNDEEDKISADECVLATDMSANVNIVVEAQDYAIVSGDGVYAKGDTVRLTAIPKYDNYIFKGWYLDDILVCENPSFDFVAKEDVTLVPVFEKNFNYNRAYNYIVSIADGFADKVKVDLCANQDLLITPYDGISIESTDSITVAVTDDGGNYTESVILSSESIDGKAYTFHNVDLYGAKQATVKISDDIIATIVPNTDNSDILFFDNYDNVISVSDDFSYVSGSQSVVNNSNETKLIELFTALYSKDGILQAIDKNTVCLEANSEYVNPFSLKNTSAENDGLHIKMFAWFDCKPLREAKTLNQNEWNIQ